MYEFFSNAIFWVFIVVAVISFDIKIIKNKNKKDKDDDKKD